MNRVLNYLIAIAVLFAGQATVTADLVLNLKYDDGSTSKSANVGDTVFVDMLLTDTDGSLPILPAEGLFSAGGRLVQSSGSALLTAISWTDIDNHWTTGNLDNNPVSSGAGVEIAKVLGSTDFFFGPAAGIGLTSIRIARIGLQITGGGPGLSQLTADILGGGFDGISTFDTNTILDASVTSFGAPLDLTVNAAAVPEPATVVLGGFSLCVAGAAAWRRRRNNRTAVVVG